MNKQQFNKKMQELSLLICNHQTSDFFNQMWVELLHQIYREWQNGEHNREEMLAMTRYLGKLLDIQTLFLMIEKAEICGEMGYAGQA